VRTESGVFIVTAANTFELGYNVRKGAEYFVSLLTSVVAEEYNVVISSEEFFGTRYLAL
jgi:hypothetical protein